MGRCSLQIRPGQQGAQYEDAVGTGSGRAVSRPPLPHTCAEGPAKAPSLPSRAPRVPAPGTHMEHSPGGNGQGRSDLSLSPFKGSPEADSCRLLRVAECLFVSGHNAVGPRGGAGDPGTPQAQSTQSVCHTGPKTKMFLQEAFYSERAMQRLFKQFLS